MTTKNHIHKYKRVKFGSKIIYKCQLHNCTHYLFREMAYNRESICWSCGGVMVLTSLIINQKQLVKPTCGCKNKSEKKIVIPSEKISQVIPVESAVNALMKRVNG